MIDLLAEQDAQRCGTSAQSCSSGRKTASGTRLGGQVHISESSHPHRRNPFSRRRYRTKPRIGLLRYYNPETGRWLNRDPIDEIGGVNLYAYVANAATYAFDILGLKSIKEYVADGITGGAEMAHRAYMRASQLSSKFPWFSGAANVLLSSIIRPALRLVVDTNPKTTSWTDLGAIWLFELGKANWNFVDGDSTTTDIQSEDGVAAARAQALAILNSPNCTNQVIPGGYEYGQTEFYDGVTSFNLTTSFTGSYNWKVTVDCDNCKLKFEVDNTTGWASGTRFRRFFRV